MKYEKLNNGINNKKVFLYGFITCALLLIIFNLFMSYAKYKSVDSVKLASGTINYENADFSLIAMYMQDGTLNEPSTTYNTKLETIPTNNAALNEEKTFCKVGDITYTSREEYEKIGINIKYTGTTLNFTGLTKPNTKCTIFFKFSKNSGDKTLAELFPDFKTTNSGTGFKNENGVLKVTGVDTGDNGNTLYKAEDNDGISYFFRGQANNNWVQFAGMRWRIIRINGDGTIRMIFQCSGADCTDKTGTNTNAESEETEYKSEPYNDNAYIGYYYGSAKEVTYENTHRSLTTNPSTIAGKVNIWYSSSGLSKYEQYIDSDAGFCNDRQVITGANSNYNGTGIGTSPTSYATYGRVEKNGTRKVLFPTLKCGVNATTADTQETNVEVDKTAYARDLFTKIGANKGNGILPHPIGLLTADEILLAGGFWGSDNSSYYLYTRKNYWTMSPYRFVGSYADVCFVSISGKITYNSVYNTFGIRPVINLKANTTFSGGNGSSGDPFVVKTN